MQSRLSALVNKLHGRFVHRTRVGVLTHHLADMIPPGASVLDIGCGDGLIDQAILERRPDISIEGLDPFPRREAIIPVRSFNGETIPYADKSFDVIMFVDVLHHTMNATTLLHEAARVARKWVLIKDHYAEGLPAQIILRFMDLVGNAGQSFAWAGDYWPQQRWNLTFKELNLKVVENRTRLGLYPLPANWIFERSYHFIAKLDLSEPPGQR